MKKIFFLLILILAFHASPSFAVDSTGCGLGSMTFKGQSGIVPQVLAVLTNQTASQTVAISSGTCGCDPYGRITGGTNKLYAFLKNNLNQFAFDVALGNGETIDAVAILLNKPTDFVSQTLKENFDFIFDSADVSVVDITLRTYALLV